MLYSGKLWQWKTLANLVNCCRIRQNLTCQKFTANAHSIINNVSDYEMATGILKYCKPAKSSCSSSSSSLLEPNGSLSEKVPSKAIELANAKVTSLKEEPCGRGPYLIFTPAQRFEVGKQAAEHGVTASMRYFAKKYPELPLKETTVRRLKNLSHCQKGGQVTS